MPRFKNPRASHREAYSRGYRGDRNLRIARGTLAYAYYAAGKQNSEQESII